MPLTPFQRGVAQILAKHRNPESHIAGGAVINRGEDGVRISDDLDIFAVPVMFRSWFSVIDALNFAI